MRKLAARHVSAASIPNPLLETLRDPGSMARLDPRAWDVLLRQARHERVHARLALQAERLGLIDRLPDPVTPHLRAYGTVGRSHERAVRWEVDRIAHALASLEVPVVLLKGAAYVMTDLPAAEGRLTGDVDIMVAKETLPAVEAALLAHGWEAVKQDDYDQAYYRKWMHELPPLRHRDRHATIDVHHTILPESGRLHPDAAAMLRAARPLAPGSPVHVLLPTDMVLHSAAHLFQDGDFTGGLRDCVDLDDLLRHFGAQPGFWEGLVPRARALDLGRPCFYMLHFVPRLLATPVPAPVREAAQASRPSRAVLRLMDRLGTAVLTPEHPDQRRFRAGVARWCLYVRSHWLRMPPLLLARHLFIKSLRRLWPRRAPKPE
ncbi:MAG: nucleotidyltransferase domain-containing protein [Planctomycetota bacterium]